MTYVVSLPSIRWSALSTFYWVHLSYFTSTMLHTMVSYATYLWDSYNTLFTQNLISSDKPGQNDWMIMEAAFWIVAGFDCCFNAGVTHLWYNTCRVFIDWFSFLSPTTKENRFLVNFLCFNLINVQPFWFINQVMWFLVILSFLV